MCPPAVTDGPKGCLRPTEDSAEGSSPCRATREASVLQPNLLPCLSSHRAAPKSSSSELPRPARLPWSQLPGERGLPQVCSFHSHNSSGKSGRRGGGSLWQVRTCYKLRETRPRGWLELNQVRHLKCATLEVSLRGTSQQILEPCCT